MSALKIYFSPPRYGGSAQPLAKLVAGRGGQRRSPRPIRLRRIDLPRNNGGGKVGTRGPRR